MGLMWYRAINYAKQQLHRCRCTVPTNIAHLLQVNPQLIAPAVRAFYARDPIAIKKVHANPRYIEGDESVASSILFTRSLYARLKSQPMTLGTPWRPEHIPETDLGPAIVSFSFLNSLCRRFLNLVLLVARL